MLFFGDPGLIGSHAKGPPESRIGGFIAPAAGLAIDVLPVVKDTTGQKVSLDIGEGPLNLGLAIRVPNPVGHERKAIEAGKGFHFGIDHRIRPGAMGNNDTGIVDDTLPAGAVHVREGLC